MPVVCILKERISVKADKVWALHCLRIGWNGTANKDNWNSYCATERTELQIEVYRERRIMVTQTVFHQGKLQSLTSLSFVQHLILKSTLLLLIHCNVLTNDITLIHFGSDGLRLFLLLVDLDLFPPCTLKILK
jgi:hypothetical protein